MVSLITDYHFWDDRELGAGCSVSMFCRCYGRRGSAALTMRHPSIGTSWHYLRRQAAIDRSV
jgi:hypothetical protein